MTSTHEKKRLIRRSIKSPQSITTQWAKSPQKQSNRVRIFVN